LFHGALEIRAGQIVKQQVIGGAEEILPARLQMREECGAVRVQAVQTFIESVLGGHGEVFVEQLVHRAADKPAAVQMPLAAGSHQLAHGEQFEHFAPGHLGLAVGQVLAPERAELQFIPETTRQPTIAEDARMLERQFGQLHLQAVEDLGRDLAVGGEQTDLFGELSRLVEDVQLLAPSRVLGVVDLAQVEDGALRGVAGAQAAVFDDAPVAMHLAVLLAGVETQKHVLRSSVSSGRSGVKEGRSPLAAFRNREACR